jgi:hypothetical protein
MRGTIFGCYAGVQKPVIINYVNYPAYHGSAQSCEVKSG